MTFFFFYVNTPSKFEENDSLYLSDGHWQGFHQHFHRDESLELAAVQQGCVLYTTCSLFHHIKAASTAL